MVNRVVMGRHNGQMGLWISRPGANVLTANDSQLLFTMTRQPFMIIGSGTLANFTGVNQTRTITIADIGYKPMVLLRCVSYRVRVSYPSATQIQFTSVGTIHPGRNPAESDVAYAYVNVTAYD